METVRLSGTPSKSITERLFKNRKMFVCSMHGKDQVMRPLIKQYLNIHAECVDGLDTDEFGTFSGEIERPFDPVTTLRKKILKGLAVSGQTLGIGNEGSFGPHPHIPFVPADQELVMIIDAENDIEIMESIITTDTNFDTKEINSISELIEFAQSINFPSHGLILKQRIRGESTVIRKGIATMSDLLSVFAELQVNDATIMAESDMRASFNPTRMKKIREATELLMKKVIQTCPQCDWPGFGVVEKMPGLPCRQCGAPTRLTRAALYQCKHCHHHEEKLTQKKRADPQFCDFCNP